MTKSVLFWASLVVGTLLIAAQIYSSLKTKAEAKALASRLALDGTTIPKETTDLLKSLATSAPLMVGGIILYGLAAVVSGALSFAASTSAGA